MEETPLAIASPAMDPDDDLHRFTCPRCARPAQARSYGPCPDCRAELVATHGGRARAVEAAPFEPSIHVVPNQVATKE